MLTPPSAWISPPAECVCNPCAMMQLWMVMFVMLPLTEKVSSRPHEMLM